MTAAAEYYHVPVSTVYEATERTCRVSHGRHFVEGTVAPSRQEADRLIREIESFTAQRRKQVEVNQNPCESIRGGTDILGRSAAGPLSTSRPTICVTDGDRRFGSASDAARHYNIARSSIIELCLGKNRRKSVGGHVFKYAEG
jgi:hypothetical protein